MQFSDRTLVITYCALNNNCDCFYFLNCEVHKFICYLVKGGSKTSLQNFRWPVWASRMPNKMAQRSNQVTTGQRFSANDMPWPLNFVLILTYAKISRPILFCFFVLTSCQTGDFSGYSFTISFKTLSYS